MRLASQALRALPPASVCLPAAKVLAGELREPLQVAHHGVALLCRHSLHSTIHGYTAYMKGYTIRV